MSTHEILVAARNIVARGWAQHSFGYDGGRCAWGACLSAAGSPDEAYMEAGHVLRSLLNREGGAGLWSAVASWNDASGRTKEEVLALFDEAIRQTAPAPDTSFLNDRIAERVQNETFWTEVLS